MKNKLLNNFIYQTNKFREIYRSKFLFKLSVQIVAYLIFYFLIYFYLYLFRHTIIDDSFITFNYAKSLKENFVWGFYGNTISNTATSPLNVILTALFGFFFDDMLTAAIMLVAIEIVIICFVAIKISGELYENSIQGVIIPLLIIVNPLIISTLGLESILYCALLLISVYMFLKNRSLALGIALGILFLVRADGVLLFIAVLLIPKENNFRLQINRNRISIVSYLRSAYFNKRSLKIISGFVFTIIPWLMFSWIVLGSFVPETLFLKLITKWSDGHQFFDGIFLYIVRYPFLVIYSILPSVVYLLLLLFQKRKITSLEIILLVFILLYFLSYSILAVPPYHWYYVPIIFSFILLLSLLIIGMLKYKFGNGKFYTGISIIIFIVIFHSIGILNYFKQNNFNPLQEAPIHTNWATQKQYKLISDWFNKHIAKGSYIKFNGEIGTMSYYCNMQLINDFTSRQFSTDRLISTLKRKGVVIDFLSDLNFLWYKNDSKVLDFNYLLEEFNYDNQISNDKSVVKKWSVSSRWIDSGVMYLKKVSADN